MAASETGDGVLLLVSSDAVYRFICSEPTVCTYQSSLPVPASALVTALALDPVSDRLWLGTNDGLFWGSLQNGAAPWIVVPQVTDSVNAIAVAESGE
jgi:hypothetical protein